MKGHITKSKNFNSSEYLELGTIGEQTILIDKICRIINGEDIAMAIEGDIYAFNDKPCRVYDSIENEIIKSYQTIGTDALSKINGSFIIIIVDKKNNRVMMARDHVGLMPLYYCNSNSDELFFSNDFNWMMNSLQEKTVNTDALFQYMFNLYTLAPSTIVNGIFKLRPASFLIWQEGHLKTKKYWDIENLCIEGQKHPIEDFQEAKKKLVDTIKDAIDLRYQPGKTGVMLSSGIDSSLVTSIACDRFRSDIETITIGSSDKKYNESEVAKHISDHLGIKNMTLFMETDDMIKSLKSLVAALPEPMGDYGALPNIFLTSSISHRFKYIMGGDGGDEIFSGYPHYEVVDMAQKFDTLGLILYCALPEKMQQKLPSGVRRVIENRDKYNKTQVVLQSEVDALNKLLKFPVQYIGDSVENPRIRPWRQRRMVHDIQTSMVDEMIYKASCCANFASVKVLSPLLDYRIIELSFRIPMKFKYRGGISKHILREIDYDFIPKQILDTPKRGFVLPIETLLLTQSDKIKLFIDKEFLDKQNLFNFEAVEKMFNKFNKGETSCSKYIWNFFLFQLWYDKYIINK